MTVSRSDVRVRRVPLTRGLMPLASLILMGILAVTVSPSAVEQLLLGWIYFPAERLPRITVDRPSVVLGVVCTILFFIVLHITLRWLVQTLWPAREISNRPWSLRSTFVLGSGACLLFAAGTAMVGATHQFVWMLTARSGSVGDVRPRGLISRAEHGASLNSQRQNFMMLGLAVHNRAETDGGLPAGGTMSRDGTLMHGWGVRLLQFLGYSTGEFDFSKPWNKPPNDRLYRSRIPVFQVAGIRQIWDAHGYGLSHLAANLHVMPISVEPDEDTTEILGASLMSPEEMADGASNTLLIGEVNGNFKPWGHPANIRDPALGLNRSPDGFGSPRSEGVFFLLADGSVRLIAADVDAGVLRRLGLPDDGRSIGEF